MVTKSILSAIAMSLCLNACVTSLGESVKVQPKAEQDPEYNAIYTELTRSYEIIRQFETKYIIHATMLNGRFRKAMADRYQRLFNETLPLLQEASNKAGFFVTIYTANGDINDLNDERFWNVQLQRGGTLKKPSVIKKLQPKEQWQPFFKDITPWSREYLVVFDDQVADPQSGTKLADAIEERLLISNADGRVSISWQ